MHRYTICIQKLSLKQRLFMLSNLILFRKVFLQILGNTTSPHFQGWGVRSFFSRQGKGVSSRSSSGILRGVLWLEITCKIIHLFILHFVINLLAAIVCCVTSLLFSVNFCYLNSWLLPFMPPILSAQPPIREKHRRGWASGMWFGAVSEGILSWRITFLNHNSFYLNLSPLLVTSTEAGFHM